MVNKMDIVTIDGKKYQVTSEVIRGTTSNMVQNTLNVDTKIFEYEIPKTEIVQFVAKQSRNNEIYMLLQDGVPAELADSTQIHVYKANSKGRYVQTIWQGTYGQLPSSSERTNQNNVVTANDNVRLDEGFRIKIDITGAVITVANTTIELRIQQFTRK